MPESAIHERLIACIEDAITKAITGLAERLTTSKVESGEDASQAVRGIVRLRSPKIGVYDPDEDHGAKQERVPTASRRPDVTSFYPPNTIAYPTLVADVSYCRQRKHLPSLADRFIIGSWLATRFVLGLDMPNTYVSKAGFEGQERTATFSVWRAVLETDEDGGNVGVCECQTNAAPSVTQVVNHAMAV